MARFQLKKPQDGDDRKGKRKTFAIVDTETSKTIKNSAISAVNQKFLQGFLSKTDAENQLRQLVSSLEREAGIFRAPATFHGDNQKILDQYWKEEYSHRDLADAKSAYYKLSQAVRALGEVSLLVGTQNEIQTAANQFKGNKQRMVVGKLNALLDFIKRRHEIRLKKARPVRTPVKYLNPAEFEKVMRLLPPDVGLLCKVLFYSGMRLSEAFAVDASKIRPDKKTVFVETQLDRHDEEKPPKWGSERPVYLIPPGAEMIREWVKVRAGLQISRDVARNRLHVACRKAFPDQPEKICGFNELRHSYAIQLLIKGVSIGMISQTLGNSESVCQRHYAGFILNPDTIQAIDAILKKS